MHGIQHPIVATRQTIDFPETRWSLVRRAGEEGPATRGALEDLCRLYWYPAYAFVRRQQPTKSASDALDLTQEFFTHLIRRQDVKAANPDRGRFRNWLIQALRRFLINQWHYETAAKRDCRELVWLDAEEAEERYRPESSDSADPERLYHRDCAMTLLRTAFAELQRECASRGWHWFSEVHHVLMPGFDDESYGSIEHRVGLPANTLKGKVHWLRNRWRTLICDKLGAQGRSAAEIDEEIDSLIRAVQLAGP